MNATIHLHNKKHDTAGRKEERFPIGSLDTRAPATYTVAMSETLREEGVTRDKEKLPFKGDILSHYTRHT